MTEHQEFNRTKILGKWYQVQQDFSEFIFQQESCVEITLREGSSSDEIIMDKKFEWMEVVPRTFTDIPITLHPDNT